MIATQPPLALPALHAQATATLTNPNLSAALRLEYDALLSDVRRAHEFGRNQSRFEAMAQYLAVIGENVSRQTSPRSKLHLLREAEAELDAEHRGWLFLTLDAEWFG